MKNLKQLGIFILARFLYPLVRLYWFVFRPKTYGVKCVVRNADEVLLIRNTYGRGRWTFPGGGIRKGETPEEAIRREVFEEIGIKIRKPKKIGEFYTTEEYKCDTVYCFFAEVANKAYSLDTKEILEARWALLSDLSKLSPYAKRVLDMYRNYA